MTLEEQKKSGIEAHKEILREHGINPDTVEIVQKVFYDQGIPVVATYNLPSKKKTVGLMPSGCN